MKGMTTTDLTKIEIRGVRLRATAERLAIAAQTATNARDREKIARAARECRSIAYGLRVRLRAEEMRRRR